MSHPLSPAIRAVLEECVGGERDDAVALCLSAGMDSLSCGLAAEAVGKRVAAYTFILRGKPEGTDAKLSRHHARVYGWPWQRVDLPNAVDTLMLDVVFLVTGLGLRKKTEIECVWPFLYLLPQIAESAVVAGTCADGYFGVSKKAMIHYRNLPTLDGFRRALFTNPDYAQVRVLSRVASHCGKRMVLPYRAAKLLDVFAGTGWYDLNKPSQKQPLRDLYPEMRRVKIGNHLNYQCGDSGIGVHFAKLLRTELNAGKYRSVIGVYNSIARGQVGRGMIEAARERWAWCLP